MKYMGSKNRHAKHILPIVLENHSDENWYVEPFVGGCNMIDKVSATKRVGSDNHYYLMAMWRDLISGDFVPPEIVTEDDYAHIRQNKELYIPSLVGFVGFSMSFGGKWFGGYRRDKKGQKGCIENMKTQSRRSRESLLKQLPNIKDITFIHESYLDLYIPKGSTVYCDPPYAKATSYKSGNFDHDVFWDWCREESWYSTLFVSEYNAPDDFECVWSKTVNNTLVKDTGSKQGIEKLFKYIG